MTKTFCDRCGKDISHDRNVVLHPDYYKTVKCDVCAKCRQRVLDAFAAVMAEK